MPGSVAGGSRAGLENHGQGAPPGAINVLLGSVSVGEAMVTHPGIDMISFTGSTAVGRKIQENEMIRVLGSRGLSGSKALHLVEVGSSVFLVGASDGGVELISEITDKESLDALKLKAAQQGPSQRRTFQDVLADIFRPARKPFEDRCPEIYKRFESQIGSALINEVIAAQK